MTKEELQEENALLKAENTRFADQDDNLRRDISKIFGFVRTEHEYGTTKTKVTVQNWSEIFAHIGKLIERQKRLQYVEDIEMLRIQQQENSIAIQRLEQQSKENV